MKTEVIVVKSVISGDHSTDILTTDGRKISLRPFLYINEGDFLEFIPSFENYEKINKLLRLRNKIPEKVVIYPPYESKERVEVSPHVFKLIFRERRSQKDWKSARFLEQFHYRGKGLNRLVGRRTLLLAECEDYGIVGYGVLSCTVGAARPRFKLFNTNFTDQMRSRLINKIVRIPRIVIHPEFRGMGLGVLMAKHLCKYAQRYWDIKGHRPIMVEVIAAMTEYHRFFESANFLPIGYTEGRKDVIVPRYGQGNWEPRDHKHYDFYEGGRSKPYLVYPIRKRVLRLIERSFPARVIRKGILKHTVSLKKTICFLNVGVRYRANDGMTSRVYDVMESFGVDKAQMFSTVLRKFSLTIHPGDVVLITGASGSGKSTVLKLLTREASALRSSMRVQGILRGHDIRRVSILSTQPQNKWPLIDQVGSDLRDAIYLLNSVGLAEAHIYLKRPRQISEGQKYRFAMAKLCHSQKPLWIADEFAATLDSNSAAILARGLRKISWKCGATMVLAAAHIDGFVGSLLPNTLVELRWGEIAKVYGIKLKRMDKGDRIQVWAHNRGLSDLLAVELGGIDIAGKLIPFYSSENLSTHAKTKAIEVRKKELIGFTAIAVRSSVGVGDIMYVG